ncbi:Glycosyl transferase family 2 [Lachnospiraceae bacterium]|nr:Glycosyl transferase family 2 [Lachnospiraceae bacterium]
MSSPLLSIIIPAYNAEKYLVQCLDSVLLSDYADIEVVVVNDGSTDNTQGLLSIAEEKDKRIRVIHQENGGVSKARNNGLKNASGQYIMFLDADDMLTEDALDRILDSIRKEDIDFRAFAYETFYDDGTRKSEYYDFSEKSCSDTRTADRIMYASSRWNECWGKIYKRSIIDTHELKFPEGVPIGEDFLFVLRYYEKCRTFYISNDAILLYRQHAGSAMRRYGAEDRLRFTEPLYDAAIGDVRAKEDRELLHEADTYYFRVVTNLFREFSVSSTARHDFKLILDHPLVQEILSHVRLSMVPGYKKHEFIMIRLRLISLALIYFRLKARAAT